MTFIDVEQYYIIVFVKSSNGGVGRARENSRVEMTNRKNNTF